MFSISIEVVRLGKTTGLVLQTNIPAILQRSEYAPVSDVPIQCKKALKAGRPRTSPRRGALHHLPGVAFNEIICRKV